MKRKQIVRLARWCEDQSRRCAELERGSDSNKFRRYHQHRGKNFAQIATFIRESLPQS
jgi:hypothetical protein